MVIVINNRYWTDEGTNGTEWTRIPESAISYGLVLQEPTEDRINEMCSAYNAAIEQDIAAAPKGECLGLAAYDAPTPQADAVAAGFGADWIAYKAYKSFREACIEGELTNPELRIEFEGEDQ